jgi:serine/threonine protein kinase
VEQGHFTEDQARETTYELLSALDYMHKQGIAHRDLKPENMLMTTKAADAKVKAPHEQRLMIADHV